MGTQTLRTFTKLEQFIDTLKLHFYHGDCTTRVMYDKYFKLVDDLKFLKEEAQAVKHSNNEMRFVKTKIGADTFHVMATTVRGFAVTIKNLDVSISLKTLNVRPKREGNESSNSDYMNFSNNPVIKIEFRASFLARMGHLLATDYIERFVKNFLLQDYLIKVSEIHLATDTQGYDFSKLDFYRFTTKRFNRTMHDTNDDVGSYFFKGTRFTGFTFGSGDKMLRIYNKSIEIRQNPDKAFVKTLMWDHNNDYDIDYDVWRIEIQYRREYLKTLSSSEYGILDTYESVMNSIADLWDRAVKSVIMKDLSTDMCIEAMTGKTLNKQRSVYVSQNTVKQRLKRADVHPYWEFLTGWKGYQAKALSPYTAPKTGSFQYFSNSLKSLLSTGLKHFGTLDPETIKLGIEAANLDEKEKNGTSLIDSAYMNVLSYLAEVHKQEEVNGVFFDTKLLESHVERYFYDAMQGLVSTQFTPDENKYRINAFKKKMGRYVSRKQDDFVRELSIEKELFNADH